MDSAHEFINYGRNVGFIQLCDKDDFEKEITNYRLSVSDNDLNIVSNYKVAGEFGLSSDTGLMSSE